MTTQEIPFDTENKTSSVFDFDRFQLKRDEKARISIMDEKATATLAHYFLEINHNTNERKGSYVRCLGDYKTVMENGVDPDRCPACKVAVPERDSPVGYPRRRFAMHIAAYRTNAKGQVLQPVSIALQIWSFGDDKFNMLTDRRQEHGDLRKKDIVITCTNEQYQRYDMDVSGRAPLWASDDQTKNQYKELVKDKSKELDRVTSRSMSVEQMEQRIAEVLGKAGNVEDVIEADEDAVRAAIDDMADETPDIDDLLDVASPVSESKEDDSGDDEPKTPDVESTEDTTEMSLDELLDS